MTIHVNPEQERVIDQAIQAGLITEPSQAVEVGVRAIRESLEGRRQASPGESRDLAELFAKSPFAGLGMDFERDFDAGRKVVL